MNRLRAGIKLIGIVVALAAVPAILYGVAGSPLPGWPIDWGLVAESLSTGAIATSTWLQLIAVAGWLAWGYLVVALAVDVVATARGRPSRIRATPVQWLASTIVALATQLSSVSMTLAPAPGAVDVEVAATSYDPIDTTDAAPVAEKVPEDTRLVVATEGDSWAGFAETAVGDPAVGPEVRELNNGRDVGDRRLDGSEAFVEAGWRLVVPNGQTAATSAPTGDAAADDDASVRRPAERSEELASDQEWAVQDGEHFWSIAETTLQDAHDTPPSENEVAAYWRELVDANEDRLLPPEDPDLIYPGQTLLIPPVGVSDAPTAPPDTDTEKERSSDVAETDDTAEHVAPRSSTPDRAGPPPNARDNGGDGSDTVDSVEEDAAGARTGSSDLRGAVGDDRDDDTDPDVEIERTGWGIPVRLAAGTAATMLFGGGVLMLLHRRRRLALQQRPVQVRLPPLTDEQISQAARLDAAAASDEVLEEFADLLCSIPAHVEPVLIAADDDGSVHLTFADDAELPTPPPAPWISDESPAGQLRRWTATLGARGPRRSIGLPLLVTLGRDRSATVLGNVAAMRLLAVAAEETSAVDRQLRAFVLEAATSRTAGPLEVTVAGDVPDPPVDHVRRVDDPAVEVAAAADEVALGIVADDRLPRLIVCHDPTTVPHLPAEADLIGVVTAGDDTATDARWRLHLDGDHRTLHQPDGRHIVLDSPDFDPDLVTAELTAYDTPDLDAADVAADVQIDLADQALPDHDADVRGWCEVALLGPFTVTLGGEPLDMLTRIVRQILAYLATHPTTSTDQLEEAVWAGQATGSTHRVRSALKRLRSELGTAPDGTSLVPRRGPGEQTIQLSPQVTTDLDRALGHLDAARHLHGDDRLARLLAALDLVRGAPFEDMPVSWATDIEHQAVAQLQDAALDAATALLEAGRLDEAEHAVRQGLLLCDPCEPLYVVWARIEHARDRRHRIPQLWTRLRQCYADDADETFDVPATPTADTQRVFAALADHEPGSS